MRKTIFASGEFYHLYNRGVEKRDIFLNDTDRRRFLALMFLCNGNRAVNVREQGTSLLEVQHIDKGSPLVGIGAYVLMSNHFHFLMAEKEAGGISRFMQKVTTGYTMYFNKLHDRSGSLFEGTFKSTHANEDSYLKYLISYIHLNPIKKIEPRWKEVGIANKKRAKQYLEEYAYSSYPDYQGRQRPENMLIERGALPRYFKSFSDFDAEIEEWLSHKG